MKPVAELINENIYPYMCVFWKKNNNKSEMAVDDTDLNEIIIKKNLPQSPVKYLQCGNKILNDENASKLASKEI